MACRTICSRASRGELLPLLSAWSQISAHTSGDRRVLPLAGGVKVKGGDDITLSSPDWLWLGAVVSANGIGNFGLIQHGKGGGAGQFIGH